MKKQNNMLIFSIRMFPKIVGKPPKMDGLFHRKPLLKWMILGVFPYFWVDTHYWLLNEGLLRNGFKKSDLTPEGDQRWNS